MSNPLNIASDNTIGKPGTSDIDQSASTDETPSTPTCKRQGSTNIDIVEKIATYMSPNPLQLTRLAMVNRDFYTVFTGDKMWLPFDAYARKKNIFAHFTKLIPSNGKLMALCWAQNGTKLEKFPVEKIKNKYAQMGYYTRILTQNKDQKIEEVYIGDAILVELLLDLGSFAIAEKHLRDSKVLALKACTRFKGNIHFTTDRLHRLDFMYTLIDETLNGGEFPYPVNSEISVQRYALRVNPSVVTFWMSLDQNKYPVTKGIISRFTPTDKELLQALSGAPQALDFCGDYWQDKEFCFEVFSSKGFQQAWLPNGFLKQCTDQDVIVRALENYPQSLFLVPAEFRKSKDMVMLALCSTSTCNSIEAIDWVAHAEAAAQLPWTDLDILRLVVDMGWLNIARKYSGRTLDRCCDDIEWVKERIKVQPSVWNDINLRLQRDRSLLMLALESKRRLVHEGRVFTKFVLEFLPLMFFDDEEVLQEAAPVNAFPTNIAENDLNDAMVKARMIASLSGDRLP